MPHAATAVKWDTLQERAENHIYLHYPNTTFMIKSGVFVVAADTVHQFFTVHQIFYLLAAKASLYLASLGFVTITSMTWSRGAILATSQANARDYIIPLIIGITEILLFVAISDAHTTRRLNLWYLFLSVHGVSAALLIKNRSKLTNIEEFEPAFSPTVLKYKSWLRRDSNGARNVSIGVFIIWIFLVNIRFRFDWFAHIALGLCLLCISLLICRNAARQYDELTADILNQKGPAPGVGSGAGVLGSCGEVG